MSANGWSGAGDWARMMRERPEFDRFGNPSASERCRIRSAVIREVPRRGEARRALENGVSYAPPAKAAPTNEESLKEGFLPGLTNRMRARLQGFPDDWEFLGGTGAVANQIGNAVAPAVGQAIGLALVSALWGWEIDWGTMMGRHRYRDRPSVFSPSIEWDPGDYQSHHDLEGAK